MKTSAALACAATTCAFSSVAMAADWLLPPWSDPRDVPPPAWAQAVEPLSDDSGKRGELQLFAEPSRSSPLRGVTRAGTTVPFFGARRGPGCTGRWWLVGPLAWTCSDDGALIRDAPLAQPSGETLGRYFFVRPEGTQGYLTLDAATDGAPDRDLDGGSAVVVVEERTSGEDRFGRTSHGLWMAMRDLGAARISGFHGEAPSGANIDFGWVIADRARVWSAPASKGKPAASLERFSRVDVRERSGAMVRVGETAWVLATDLAVPTVAPPPAEARRPTDRWIDVDLSTQTLVAYEGTRPVYATLVSTGRGAAGTPNETPLGVHRVWVKLAATDMASTDRSDSDAHYSLEDVPYVQFFDHSVGLHGTYWHGDFGHTHSHGCVNLAIADARWLFDFTEPHLPAGWDAVYPTPLDDATVVRVR